MSLQLMRGCRSANAQRGAILVVSMLVLTVMTLLALGASQTLRMQERMATTLRDRDSAFQAAEAALRAGERVVGDPALTSPPTRCNSGRCRIYERNTLGVSVATQSTDWWNERAWSYAGADSPSIGSPSQVDPIQQQPRYLIEEFAEITDALTISPQGPPPSRMHYRITAMGQTRADTAQVILQSTYARRFPDDPAAARWDTGKQRPAQQRRIITVNSDGTPIAFRWETLDASRKAQLGGDAGAVDDLRADPSATRSLLRTRAENGSAPDKRDTNLSSSTLFVGPPRFRYRDSLETAAYSRFADIHGKRAGMVYVSADNGTLHGFDTATDAEEFAFIPSPTLSRLRSSAPKTPERPSPIDSALSTADVLFGDAWHTVLVGGLNKSGQGIYALDITDPSSFAAAEANPAKLLLWEFTDADDADLGSTYSQPVVAKLQDGTWAAIFGNGYSSRAADGIASTTGNAVLYIVNVATGDIIRKLDTGVGIAHAPAGVTGDNGLSTPAVADVDGDRIADHAYAGDLYGNLWKFDLSAKRSADWNVAWGGRPLYRARNANGNVQPITVRPEIARSGDGAGVVVLFGTGEPEELADRPPHSDGPQSLYGILDHNRGAIADRAELRAQEITAELAIASNDDSPAPAASIRVITSNALGTRSGWYLDLAPPVSADKGEKLIANPTVVDGKVIFRTRVPGSEAASKVWTLALDVSSGGSGSDLDQPLFDVSQDGRVDDADTVTATLNGVATRIAVSGMAAASSHAPVTLSCSLGDTGRQSWRQIR